MRFVKWLILSECALFDDVAALVGGFTDVGTSGQLTVGGCKIAHRIFDYRLNVGVVIGGEGFVAGLEIEDLTVSALKKATCPEHLAAREIGKEKELVGGGNNEGLAVGLLGVKLKVAVDATGYGVAGLNYPNDLGVTAFTPAEVCTRAKKSLEGLGMMAGVQEYCTHTGKDCITHEGGYLIGDELMSYVAPPDKHVALLEHLLGDVAFVIFKRGALDLYIVVSEKVGKHLVYTVGVYLFCTLLHSLVIIFVKNKHSYHFKIPFGSDTFTYILTHRHTLCNTYFCRNSTEYCDCLTEHRKSGIIKANTKGATDMKRTLIDKIPIIIPSELTTLVEGARIYDSSCSPEARVYFIDKGDGFYLKSAAGGSLDGEAGMTAYFHSLGLGTEVMHYSTLEGRDYLLTRRVAGEDCTHAEYLENPEKLCDTIATKLRELHEIRYTGCPVQNRTADYLALAEENYRTGNFDSSHFPDNFGYKSAEEAITVLREGKSALKSDVLIHGDYCLPNIMLDNWRFSAFIDVDHGGIGDRHIDLFWGTWTMWFNLKTWKYTDRFLDAYGRDKADPEILKIIAAAEVFG